LLELKDPSHVNTCDCLTCQSTNNVELWILKNYLAPPSDYDVHISVATQTQLGFSKGCHWQFIAMGGGLSPRPTGWYTCCDGHLV